MEDVDFSLLFRPLSIQLRVLRKYNFFTEIEIEGCQNFRSYYEQILGKKFITYEEILVFLKSELNLLYELKQKPVAENLREKKNIITLCSSDFLKKLLAIVTSYFPDEIRLWLIYVSFLKSIKDSETLSGVLADFTRIHGDTPAVFQIASRLAREDLKNVLVARKYVSSGLRLHLDSTELHKESFILELNIAQTEYNRLRQRNIETQENREIDLIKLTQRAEFAYVTARLKITDVEFYLDLFHLARGFPCADRVESRIRRDLQHSFPREETMWNALTKVKLEQLKDLANKPFYRTIIIEVIEIYETILEKHLNTQEMWSMYIDQLLEIDRNTNVELPKFKRNCVLTALNAAYQKDQLTEKYYLIWCDMQKGEDKKIQLLKKAAVKLPTSVALWVKMINLVVVKNDDTKIWALFQESLAHFHNDKAASMTLWNVMVRYYMVFYASKLEWCFRESIKCQIVSADYKPRYLEWLILKQGIQPGREFYDEICFSPPFSATLHEKMIEFGRYQVNPSSETIDSMRQAHTILAEHFGDEDVSVWMKWIRFENEESDGEKNVKRIRERALRHLPPRMVPEFNSQFAHFQNNCSSSVPKPTRKSEVVSTPAPPKYKVNEARSKWKSGSKKHEPKVNKKSKNQKWEKRREIWQLFSISGLLDIQLDSD